MEAREEWLLHWQARSLCLLAALTAFSLVKSISHEAPNYFTATGATVARVIESKWPKQRETERKIVRADE